MNKNERLVIALLEKTACTEILMGYQNVTSYHCNTHTHYLHKLNLLSNKNLYY